MNDFDSGLSQGLARAGQREAAMALPVTRGEFLAGLAKTNQSSAAMAQLLIALMEGNVAAQEEKLAALNGALKLLNAFITDFMAREA